MFGFLRKIFGTAQDRTLKKYQKIVDQVNVFERPFSSLSEQDLLQKTTEFKDRYQKGESLDAILPEAFAVVKCACKRLCGKEVHVSGYDQRWDMVPYDVQLLGAIALHKGAITEMHTGEGKTLTATMALYLNALSGKPIHLVTVNDYLARRDCEWTGSVLRFLGITTAPLTSSTPAEMRKELYKADVVYGTASEFGFDYLRDNSMATRKEEQVQRGFYFAIIDEADSILIDEARTPLIISGPSSQSRQLYSELKEGIAELVRLQRNLCNKLATEAKKSIDALANKKRTREEGNEWDEALTKLWKVSKGTPGNKVLMKVKEEPELRQALDKIDLHLFSDQNKEEKIARLSELYLIVDEKSNEFELTDKGILAWPACTQEKGTLQDFVMLDLGHDLGVIDKDSSLSEEERVQKRLLLQEEDLLRKERAHNLRQLLRAHLLMERDVDYIVQENKIVIIDENTGRPQPSRRFSDGLHQAIEAKEGVPIQRETQTYATITIQNFFRMYEKLAGMTGTIVTDASEIKEIYHMDVLEIPTHKKCVRKELNDTIYMSEREKYNAILKEVQTVHATGRPILIGTESVEISEKLSRIFSLNNVPHVVLNAKQNDKEAEIVASAGEKGRITIATNMAGRGTDIKLYPGVADLGGLHVIGTTRHESRRIDRQLRGRCARQGDPGSAQFFLSFEDRLLKYFTSPTMTSLLMRFKPPEGEGISAPILDRSIATAQKRIETRNFTIRSHTLKLDDVMNLQRKEVYSFRNELIHQESLLSLAEELISEVIHDSQQNFFLSRASEQEWQPEAFRLWLIAHFPVSFPEGTFDDELATGEELADIASQKVIEQFREKMATEEKKLSDLKESGLVLRTPPTIDDALRHILVMKADRLWQGHLLHMDHLRVDVTLRTYGQKDPISEFKLEAFKLFETFSSRLKTECAHDLFKFQFFVPDVSQMESAFREIHLERDRNPAQEMEALETKKEEERASQEKRLDTPQQEEATDLPKVGRNDDCPCGSGKKYKKCCGIAHESLSKP